MVTNVKVEWIHESSDFKPSLVWKINKFTHSSKNQNHNQWMQQNKKNTLKEHKAQSQQMKQRRCETQRKMWAQNELLQKFRTKTEPHQQKLHFSSIKFNVAWAFSFSLHFESQKTAFLRCLFFIEVSRFFNVCATFLFVERFFCYLNSCTFTNA